MNAPLSQPRGNQALLVASAALFVLFAALAVYQKNYANRVSFIDALRWLCTLLAAKPTGAMPELIVNPSRTGRWCPRVKKRRMKEYDLMNKPRSAYAEPSARKGVED